MIRICPIRRVQAKNEMLLPNAGKEWYNGVEVITLLKVFLVEDECVVREGLRDCIDWERYGFEFCGDAPDGELALPQIRKLRPDILITDIKMPFMDGLALSKLVCAELPETRIILISGHNDFEFAQEAIEIGVEQYLLKPVTKASLLKTLEDVSRKIDEEREQKDYLRRFQQEGPEYEQFARRKFFEQITSGTLRVSEIYEQAKSSRSTLTPRAIPSFCSRCKAGARRSIPRRWPNGWRS